MKSRHCLLSKLKDHETPREAVRTEAGVTAAMKTICFSLLLCFVGACGAAPSGYKLPVGESGDGASVRAFVEVCALSNKGDGPALFNSVQESDYHIGYEVVQNGKRYEAKATSFEGRREGVCPIFVAMEDFGSDFTCKFVLLRAC